MLRIIVPAYNEERNIAQCLKNIAIYSKGAGLKFKIYVVNDGSTDNTPNILKDLSKKMPLYVITHNPNKGVAQAFRSGISRVVKDGGKNDFVIIMEADHTSDERLIPKIVKKLKNGSDIVICSRYRKGGKYLNFPLRRSILSVLANMILRILFPIQGVRDYTIFYRGYKMWVFQKLLKKHKNKFIKTTFYVANSEILIKMARFSPKILEIPFVYNYGKKKKPSAMKIVSNIKAYLTFIREEFLTLLFR